MALGETLQAAREARGLTTAQVAEGTRMMVQMVEEIEQEDFHRIAAPIYGKGFIRLFAEYVGVEPDPLIREYLARHVRPETPGFRTSSPDAAKRTPSAPQSASPKRSPAHKTSDAADVAQAATPVPLADRASPEGRATDPAASPGAFALQGDALEAEPDLFATQSQPPESAISVALSRVWQRALSVLRPYGLAAQALVERGVRAVSELPRAWLLGGAAVVLAAVLAIAGLLRLAAALRPADEGTEASSIEYARIIPPPPPYLD